MSIERTHSRIWGLEAWTIWVLATVFVVWLFAIQTGHGIVSPDIQRDAHLTISQVAVAASIYTWVFAVIQFFSGALLDRYGARPLLAIAVGLVTVGAFLHGQLAGGVVRAVRGRVVRDDAGRRGAVGAAGAAGPRGLTHRRRDPHRGGLAGACGGRATDQRAVRPFPQPGMAGVDRPDAAGRSGHRLHLRPHRRRGQRGRHVRRRPVRRNPHARLHHRRRIGVPHPDRQRVRDRERLLFHRRRSTRGDPQLSIARRTHPRRLPISVVDHAGDAAHR